MPPLHDHRRQPRTMSTTVRIQEAANEPRQIQAPIGDAWVPQSQPWWDASAGGDTVDVSKPTLQFCDVIAKTKE